MGGGGGMVDQKAGCGFGYIGLPSLGAGYIYIYIYIGLGVSLGKRIEG